MADNTMKLDLVQEMVTNYQTKQYQSILTNKDNPMEFDAQSVRFSLDALKNFITTIEEQVALHPEHDLKKLGVRFYYCAYPESESWNDHQGLANVPTEYAKLHTLVAIPTAVINDVESDFDPLDVNTYTGDKPTQGGLLIMAENHGGLTPPNPNENLWF